LIQGDRCRTGLAAITLFLDFWNGPVKTGNEKKPSLMAA
jgi:hypothetical protein